MKITLTHNGFHGYTTVNFIADPVAVQDATGTYYEANVSLATAKRLNRAVCGSKSCKCYERIVDDSDLLLNRDGTGVAIVKYRSDDGGKTGEVRGRYAQNL